MARLLRHARRRCHKAAPSSENAALQGVVATPPTRHAIIRRAQTATHARSIPYRCSDDAAAVRPPTGASQPRRRARHDGRGRTRGYSALESQAREPRLAAQRLLPRVLPRQRRQAEHDERAERRDPDGVRPGAVAEHEERRPDRRSMRPRAGSPSASRRGRRRAGRGRPARDVGAALKLPRSTSRNSSPSEGNRISPPARIEMTSRSARCRAPRPRARSGPAAGSGSARAPSRRRRLRRRSPR